jgi:DNA-binding protein HU-beta
MNKTEMVQALVDKTGATKVLANAMLEAFQEIVTEELKAKGSVVLVGFGSFQIVEKKARTGRNPGTGEPISIAASSNPTFKAGTVLKRAVN